MSKIDKLLVEKVKWENDPATFDLRLHALGKRTHDTFFVVNPLYDPWVLDYINPNDIAIQDEKCIVWKTNDSWIIKKFKSFWTPEDGYMDIECDIKIKTTVEYNPDLNFLKFNVDDRIPLEDAVYEYVYYLDPSLDPAGDKPWVAKVRFTNITIQGSKDRGSILPKENYLPRLIYNNAIPNLNFDHNFSVSCYDLKYENVWYLDDRFNPTDDKIWVAKITHDYIEGLKDQGTITPVINEFDVVFISYNEPNAESNWQRVLEKAPNARRVKNVKGIFEAHKRAAEIATTDMFYVVDGDAELVDSFNFDFIPNVFDMDCVHLWTSVNPINNLEYGYGGVKLFPRQLLLDAKTWNVDLTTGLGKLKLISKISNLTAFNYDEFTTWRSAFRECAKLSADLRLNNFTNLETEYRLKIWTTVGEDSHMGKYAIAGAKQGQQFGSDNYNEPEKLKLINDYDWMKNEFDKQCTKQ